MEKIDWNNPPGQLRFTVNLKNNKVVYIRDDVNNKPYDTDADIKRVFGCGAGLVKIAISENGPFSRWELIPEEDHAGYIKRMQTEIFRYLTYSRIELIIKNLSK